MILEKLFKISRPQVNVTADADDDADADDAELQLQSPNFFNSNLKAG